MSVDWSSGAREDLARIFAFNAAFDEDRSERIDARLLGVADLIERNPLIGRRIGRSNVRERSLSDIQYVVRYHVGVAGGLTILNVRHMREHRQGTP